MTDFKGKAMVAGRSVRLMVGVLLLCDVVSADAEVKFQNGDLSNVVFADNLLLVTSARSLLDCSVQCFRQQTCLAFTFNKMTSSSSCRGHSAPLTSLLSSSAAPGAKSYLRKMPVRQKPLPVDCEEAFQMGLDVSKVQMLKVNQQYPPFPVACAQNWTIILRRLSTIENFYRGWQDYVDGFGDRNSAYWLGLEAIHQMTSQKPHALRVEIKDLNDVMASADYLGFSLGPGSDFYRMHFDIFIGGSAGDSLGYHNDLRFSTKDMDNDNNAGNCAVNSVGAWWYGSCLQANLCGIYKPGSIAIGQGVNWATWKGLNYTLPFAQMMIKALQVTVEEIPLP